MKVPLGGTPGPRVVGPSWHPRTVEELGQESSFKGSPSLDPPGSAGRSPRSPPPPRAAACMASASGDSWLPAAFQPCPGPHSPGGQAAGAAPARRARARAPHVSCCPDRRRELGGLRGSKLPVARSSGPALLIALRFAVPGFCPARCCPERGLQVPPAGVSSRLPDPFLCARLCLLSPHLSRRAPPYNKPTGSLPLQN